MRETCQVKTHARASWDTPSPPPSSLLSQQKEEIVFLGGGIGIRF